MEERKDPPLEEFKIGEVLASKHNDSFCAEISRGLNGGEKMSLPTTKAVLSSVKSTLNIILTSLIS